MKKYLLLLFFSIIPWVVSAEELIPNSVSGIVLEANSGKIIFEKEKDKEVSVASMTKMVVQIIVLEDIESGKIKWDDMVTVSLNASNMGGSQIYLEQGEKMSVEDLMKGISVASGNDATVAMAEYISGSEEKFVERMNSKVKKLGLKHTHFKNVTGLDEDDHYSSAYDMALIAQDLVMNHPSILRFSSIYEDYLREGTDNKFWLVNTNKLVGQYEGCDGLKTGHTDDAGYCLAATSMRNSVRLIAIVLGEKDSKIRNKETIELLDYGFSNIKVRKVKNKNSVVKRINLEKATVKSLPLVLKDDLVVVENKNTKSKKYNYKIHVKNKNYPINKGDNMGYMEAFSGTMRVARTDIISRLNVDKISLINYLKNNLLDLVKGDF